MNATRQPGTAEACGREAKAQRESGGLTVFLSDIDLMLGRRGAAQAGAMDLMMKGWGVSSNVGAGAEAPIIFN